MPLTSADGTTIIADGKALLVIFRDNVLEYWVSKCDTHTIGRNEQVINLCPAMLVQSETTPLGPMPQDQAQKFAEAYKLWVHTDAS